MNWPLLQSVAQISVERVVNSLPEGLMIALSAWLLLRVVKRQNAGTRFAVWFTALIAVAGLPFLGGMAGGRLAALTGAALIAVPHATVPLAWAVILFGAWAAAACVAMVRLAAGLWRVRTIRRSCAAIDMEQLEPGLREIVEEMSRGEFGTRAVKVAVSEMVRVPAAIGFRRPMIVLPPWTIGELSAGELKAVLFHEFAHLERRDDWTNLLQKMVGAVFFFHPAVWWIDAKLSLEREMACDDAVVAETGNPRAYAGCLVSLLEKSAARRGWVMAQAAVHRAREASLRIAQILDARRPGTTRIWKPALGFAGLLSAAGLAMLLCAPQLVVFAPEKTTAYAESVSPAGFAAAAVVPATLRMRGTQPETPKPTLASVTTSRTMGLTASLTTTRTATKPSAIRRHHATTFVKAAMPAANKPLVVAVKADQRSIPVAQDLVFMQPTPYVQTDAAGRQVRVWRVILINPGRGEMQEGFIASVI